jgi:hypothetical protein
MITQAPEASISSKRRPSRMAAMPKIDESKASDGDSPKS